MGALLVVGAGGHGKVVADAALAAGQWDQIVFADDRWKDIGFWRGIPVIGSSQPRKEFLAQYPEVVVAVGDASTRLGVMRDFEDHGYRIVSVYHPTAVVSPSVDIGMGTVLLAGSVVNADSHLGRGCIVNTNASVDHDCWIEDGVHVCPGATVAGNVRIGGRSWVGSGAVIIQGLIVGSDATIGAGAAVINDVADGVTVVGVPAKMIID